MKDFTFIVAYRHSPDRINNLRQIISWIKKLNCDIIIVESDKESFLGDTDIISGTNHIFLKNEYPFNKSWCFDVGWKSSLTNKIVFGDADLVMDYDGLLESLSNLDNYDCVNPYSSVVDLLPEETNQYLNSKSLDILFTIDRPGRGETDHQKVPFCGGIILFTKDALEKVVGWNEDFWGWGAEDDFMSVKVYYYLNHLQMKNKCYHLYHIRGNINQELYFRNFNLYKQYLTLDKTHLFNSLEQIKDKIGKLEKI